MDAIGHNCGPVVSLLVKTVVVDGLICYMMVGKQQTTRSTQLRFSGRFFISVGQQDATCNQCTTWYPTCKHQLFVIKRVRTNCAEDTTWHCRLLFTGTSEVTRGTWESAEFGTASNKQCLMPRGSSGMVKTNWLSCFRNFDTLPIYLACRNPWIENPKQEFIELALAWIKYRIVAHPFHIKYPYTVVCYIVYLSKIAHPFPYILDILSKSLVQWQTCSFGLRCLWWGEKWAVPIFSSIDWT